jgi:hypothetical protein
MKVRLFILGALSAAMLAFAGTAAAGDVHAVHATGGQDVHALHVASSSWTGFHPGSSSWTGLHPGSSTWNSLHLLGEKWGNGRPALA